MSDAHTDQSRELLPCPFCGEQPTIKSEGKVSFIICPEGSSCIGSGLAIGFESDNERGIEAWNRRTTTEQSSGVELPEPQWHKPSPMDAAHFPYYTPEQVRTLLAGVKDSLTVAPAVPQGWKPIESAPKDGSEILLMSQKGRVANSCWMTANNRCGAWLWAYIKQEPTNWMPLPQPPKEQT